MPILHTLLVKLKPETDAFKFVEASKEALAKLPTISTFKVGKATNDPTLHKGCLLPGIEAFAQALKGFTESPSHAELRTNLLLPNADGVSGCAKPFGNCTNWKPFWICKDVNIGYRVHCVYHSYGIQHRFQEDIREAKEPL